ncbi:type III secretion system export apparatus subunit SctR [Glaciimonas sp. GG7]
MEQFTPLTLAFSLALFSLVPFIVVMTTSFLKIAVVSMLLRNALGVQQIPPNIVLYGIALILSVYVMGPIFLHMYEVLRQTPEAMTSLELFIETILRAAEPLRNFLVSNTHPSQTEFFLSAIKKIWPPELVASATGSDFLILIPSFLVTELTEAFEIGFLLYIPFVIIDLIVQSILLALGMMMLSPMTVSLPLKLLLFIMAEGWARMYSGLVLSYAHGGG